MSLQSVKETQFQIRCSEAEKTQWKTFALTKGAPLSVYVRALLNALVEKEG